MREHYLHIYSIHNYRNCQPYLFSFYCFCLFSIFFPKTLKVLILLNNQRLLDDCSSSTRMYFCFHALSCIARNHQRLNPFSIMHRSTRFRIIIPKFVTYLLQIRSIVATYRLDQSHDSFLKIFMFFDKCSIDSLFLPSVTSAYISIVVFISA